MKKLGVQYAIGLVVFQKNFATHVMVLSEQKERSSGF